VNVVKGSAKNAREGGLETAKHRVKKGNFRRKEQDNRGRGHRRTGGGGRKTAINARGRGVGKEPLRRGMRRCNRQSTITKKKRKKRGKKHRLKRGRVTQS